MTTLLFGDFTDINNIYEQFGSNQETLDDLHSAVHVLAIYHIDGYEGTAYVYWVDSRNFIYEVEGSHCSCNGLEKSGWAKAPVTKEYILKLDPEPYDKDIKVFREMLREFVQKNVADPIPPIAYEDSDHKLSL